MVPVAPAVGQETSTCVFVNELHYDNDSTDTGEAIEIAGPAGTDLSDWSVILYNGNGGGQYDTVTLTGTVPDEGAGFGTLSFPRAGIQNGSPDGLALVDSADRVLQFLSYEGSFTATNGPANGLTSTDIGVAEGGSSPIGFSLQLTGTGASYEEFDWNPPADDSFGAINAGQTFSGTCTPSGGPPPPPPPPPPEDLEIYEVQGSGMSSPFDGQVVTIDGIVVGDFQGNDFAGSQLGGFHLQEATGDGDPATSDGIFVFAPDAPDVNPGDFVEVTGTVDEFFDLTEITDVTDASLPPRDSVDPDELVPIVPTSVMLPVSDQSEWEPFEGMLVIFEQDLFISEFFNFDRFGEIVLTTFRQFQGTQVADPGAEANAVAETNTLNRITLDDGRTSQNSDPAIHPDGEEFTRDHTFRGGDILEDVTGVIDFSFGLYRIQPTDRAEHIATNPRPPTPASVDGQIKVATFNVLNFFTGLGDDCGPTGGLDCRGADDTKELERQLDKLVAGIIALDADIVGIQEVENDIREDDGTRAHDAVLTLVEALNAEEGAGTWAWVGPANHYNDYPVRNDLIYRPDSVMAVGDPVALEHEAFDKTRPGETEPMGRPPLAQTFTQNVDRGSRQPFTVVVNHFKSKSSGCDVFGDPDTGDGQGDCNLTRVAQAEALLDFIDVLDDDSSGVLAIGDFNSYAMEDPIKTLEAGGLTDLVGWRFGDEAYTFVFDGQLGTLDYILSTRSMRNYVDEVMVFHINADEPDILDYDMTFKKDAQDDLYEPIPYRVSDHDPVIVGLSFGGPRGR
ncbi:MAG: ExeM/NucH family extracellular endonuclease [Acidimicrobiia bacterium]